MWYYYALSFPTLTFFSKVELIGMLIFKKKLLDLYDAIIITYKFLCCTFIHILIYVCEWQGIFHYYKTIYSYLLFYCFAILQKSLALIFHKYLNNIHLALLKIPSQMKLPSYQLHGIFPLSDWTRATQFCQNHLILR